MNCSEPAPCQSVVVGSMGRVMVASMLDAARVRAIADASAAGMVDADERVEMDVEPPQPPIRASTTRRLTAVRVAARGRAPARLTCHMAWMLESVVCDRSRSLVVPARMAAVAECRMAAPRRLELRRVL